MTTHSSTFVRVRGFAAQRPGASEAQSNRTVDDVELDADGEGSVDIPSEDFEVMRNHDPLALEPLTSDEIEQVTAHQPDIDEELQLPWRELARDTEATFPVDTDAEALSEQAADSELDVWMRPKSKR
jgi:hypothetical protein